MTPRVLVGFFASLALLPMISPSFVVSAAASELGGAAALDLDPTQFLHLPPWHVERGFADYLNQRVLSRNEIALRAREMIEKTTAQDREDLYLLLNFYLNERLQMPQHGLYLEIGALDGTNISNTWAFERVYGWRGVLFEPGPNLYRDLAASRPDNVLAHVAVCSKPQRVHFVENGGPSGIIEFMPATFRNQWHPYINMANLDVFPTITCVPLQSVLDAMNATHFDFFVLDVEGAELEVLITLDFSRVTFNIILVESDVHNPGKNEAVRLLLVSSGYTFEGNHLRSDWFVRTALIADRKKEEL